jgi:DNA invertase Pin-like site-specific DNA recombinase
MRVRIIAPTVKSLDKKKRVCAYARVSTDNFKQGESLENQVQYYENLIKNNPKYEFVEVFADNGITGSSANRSEFQRMIKLCREGKIDLIITKSISRFARSTILMLETVRELKELSVDIRFEKENINTLSGDGELMLTVLSSFAEEEGRNVSEHLRWKYRNKFKQGELVINTNRFLGYDKDKNGNLVINEAEASIVKRIFQKYVDGKGSGKIAKELNAEGVRTVGNKQWHGSTILKILKNEKYKGDAQLQKYFTPKHLKKISKRNTGELDSYYIKNNHQAIVSEALWEKAQLVLRRRSEDKGNTKYQNEKLPKKYPMTGMLYCSKCGASLKRRTWNSKSSYKKVVWQCSNYVKNGKNACEGTTIEDTIASKANIIVQTIVKEEYRNGEKHYVYTGKN